MIFTDYNLNLVAYSVTYVYTNVGKSDNLHFILTKKKDSNDLLSIRITNLTLSNIFITDILQLEFIN